MPHPPPPFDAFPVTFEQARAHGQQRAAVTYVPDGDTIHALCDVGFDVLVGTELRLADFSAAEVDASDPAARAAGLRAQAYLRWLLPVGAPVLVRVYRTKSGTPQRTFTRYVAAVDCFVEGTQADVATTMRAAGHAWPPTAGPTP